MENRDKDNRRVRESWEDYNHRQEFEHELINRKITWLLATQALLFAAYGVTFADKVAADLSHDFRSVVAWSGLSVAALVGAGVVALGNSKRRSFREYRDHFGSPSDGGLARHLPPPLNQRELQWGVDTPNTRLALLPDILLPFVFVFAWAYLLA